MSSTRNGRSRIRSCLALALSMAATVNSASAAIKTFDGGPSGTGFAWNTATNWVGDAALASGDEVLIDNSTLATLPGAMSTLSITLSDLVFNTNNTTGVGVNETTGVGTPSNRTLTISGSGGGVATLGAGGAIGDLILLGTNATSNTVTLGGNLGSGSFDLILKFTTSGNINVVGAGATLRLDVSSYDTSNANATGLTKTGAGTLVLGSKTGTDKLGDSNFANGITIAAGRLKLGASNRIASKPIVLSGGTFDTSGYNETVGTLSLQGNSIIDLGTSASASALKFSASNGTAWQTGKQLEIRNWSGTLNTAGGSDQLFVGTTASGLTPAQLSQIKFNINGSLYNAAISSNGEVYAIPEPACVALAGGAVMALLARRSRRNRVS